MANVKITELTAATALAGTDVLPIVDVGADATKKVSVSDLLRNLPDGTASAPALAFADDQNTGVLSPAANELAFATSGTQRLVIDSSGNCGIGASAPAAKLDIAGNQLFSAANPQIQFNAGGPIIRLPSANTLAFLSDSTTERMRIDSSGNVGIGNSSPTAKLTINGDIHLTSGDTEFGRLFNDAAVYHLRAAANMELGLGTAATERLRIDGSGNVGIGTTSPATDFHIHSSSGSGNSEILLTNGDTGATATDGFKIALNSGEGGEIWNYESDYVRFGTNNSERMRIDSSGRVGIGTSSPTAGAPLTVNGGAFFASNLTAAATDAGAIDFVADGRGTRILSYGPDGSTKRSISFHQGVGGGSASESMRIDSSGRVGIGETSPSTLLSLGTSLSTFKLKLYDAGDANDYGFGSQAGTLDYHSGGNHTFYKGGTERMRIDSSGDIDLSIAAANNATRTVSLRSDYGGGTFFDNAALALVQDNSGSSGGHLQFLTTGSGGSSPTERMRIDSAGDLLIGRTSDSSNDGITLRADGFLRCNRSNSFAAYFNRNVDDGTVISIRQANVQEGSISVSGSTVSYNGGHLSRWSQLPGGAERTEILRGSVLSNLDEMCEWGEEDNEQLNRMQLSNVKGDVNVSGVFQAWDDDDDTYTNDFYCAMTGDFIIRIAQGTTVARGDLLMSAGDGTAKPQDDDIVRSKTIAKVTSTTVSATYADGSYCIPCVLMAC